MKTIITFTFLFFTFFSFSQTTREEVVERNKVGQKLIVNTYSGTGNSEKLIKRTYYGDNNLVNCVIKGDQRRKGVYDEFNSPISLKPSFIEYFGKFKEISTYTEVCGDPYKNVVGDTFEYQSYGVIKTEKYYSNGSLYQVWKIEDCQEKEVMLYPDCGRVKVKYMIIP
jgi:hypothetical protein